MGSGASIYDVANLAGTSISTVSRYLNTPNVVNKDTAQRIAAAIEELGYLHQGNAGPRSSRAMGRIGVLTPFFPAPSFVQRLQGMTPVFRQANIEMVIYTVETPEQLQEYLQSLPFMRRLDGLIIMSMIVCEADSRRLIQSGLQVVMVEHANPLFSRVVCDNIQGGRLAAAHFASKGYGPCAFIGDHVDLAYSLHPTEERLEGFREGLRSAGQALDEHFIRSGEASVESARSIANDLLSLPRPPRAIFAASDLMATGVLKAARDKGLRVPQDLAVLGFDDIELADYLDLSTISQSLTESGRLAAELLVARIREPNRPLQTVNLDVQVIPRATT